MLHKKILETSQFKCKVGKCLKWAVVLKRVSLNVFGCEDAEGHTVWGEFWGFLIAVGLKMSGELIASLCVYPLLSLSAGAVVNITHHLSGDVTERNRVTVDSGWLRIA